MYRDRVDAKLKAKSALKGNTWRLFFLILGVELLGSLPSIVLGMVGSLTGIEEHFIYILLEMAVSGAAAIFILPINCVLDAKFLALVRNENDKNYSLLFYYRNKSAEEIIKAYLLSGLYIVLGFILFIIPGIILSIRYSMIGFVFADNPDIDYRSAMRRSKEITDGRKWDIFVFMISFIGWYLLAILTLGLVMIYVSPYYSASFAALYDGYCPKEKPHNDGYGTYTGDPYYGNFSNNDPYGGRFN